MNRITITLDDDLMAEIDGMIDSHGYQSRSEAIRDLARSGLRQASEDSELRGSCIAALVYSYSHGERELPKRLSRILAEHHDLTVATTHFHLDHESSFEISVLRGSAQDVRHLAEHIIAERGVVHGRLVMVPADVRSEKHPHGGKRSQSHMHVHVRKAAPSS